MVSLYGPIPLPLEEEEITLTEEFMQNLNFKSRNEIFTHF